MRRWALGSASLKVNSTDTTDDPRALCFRVSPATWFASFPAKRGGEDALSAQRMSRKKNGGAQKNASKRRAPRIAVRDALAQMRGADSIDEAEQTRCASRRHAPVQPSPPAPAMDRWS